MAIYIEDGKKVSELYGNVDGVKRKIVSAWADRDGITTKVFGMGGGTKTVTWSDGTDAEIIAMLDAHYAGEIDIHDYWHVGDTRIINLSAMSSVVGETQPAQKVTMTLMNVGGKELVEPINGHTECAFIVGQKSVLTTQGALSSKSSVYTWNACARRTWCNGVYRNAFPETIRPIFKKHINRSASNLTTGFIDSEDYFALPSEKEVLGTSKYANSTVQSEDVQFKYYTNSANRKKYPINVSSGDYPYLLRSVRAKANATPMVLYITTSGSAEYQSPTAKRYIAPFGAI